MLFSLSKHYGDSTFGFQYLRLNDISGLAWLISFRNMILSHNDYFVARIWVSDIVYGQCEDYLSWRYARRNSGQRSMCLAQMIAGHGNSQSTPLAMVCSGSSLVMSITSVQDGANTLLDHTGWPCTCTTRTRTASIY